MRRDCANVEEAIWNSARSGTELTERDRRHIERCESCARAMAEARTSVDALGRLRPCPPAPDCGARLRSGIESARRRRVRLRLTWAAAPFALALVMGVMLHRLHPVQQPVLTPKVRSAEQAPVRRVLPPSSPSPTKVASGQTRRAHRCVRRARSLVARTQPANEPEVAAQRQTKPADRIVNITCLSEPTDSTQCYRTVEIDEATGVVTSTLTRRSGDSVDITIEVPPPSVLPAGGAIYHTEPPRLIAVQPYG